MEKKVTFKLLVAILSAGMLSFLGILDETATTVTFPTLIKEFKITTGQVQWVNTLVLLVIAIIVPLSSQIRLRISTKRIFIAGILFFMLGLIVDIFTPRFDLLLLGRAFQGIGTGIGLPLMYNIILTKVPKSKLGFMMGIGTMITAAAVALGPVFGGIVTNFLNWRWIFIISVFLIIISLFIWIKVSWNDKAALISPRLFKNITFSMQLICYCFAKISTLALGFIFPIYIQIVNHGSASLAGWIMFPGAIIDALMAAIAGKVLDKKGPQLPILLGIIASLTSLFIMCLSSSLTNLGVMWLYALYYGGYGMCFSSLMTSGLTSLSEENHAQGNAIFNTLQQFSGAVGTALAGTLISISQNNKSMPESITTAEGARWTFIVLIILIISNLILALIFVPKNTNYNK